MLNISLEFNQKDFRRLTVNNQAVSPNIELSSGAMLVHIERFGFSCNNLASAMAPGVASVWPQAFAAEGDNLLLPVWGIAQVVAANNAEYEVDDWIFGCFPMSRYCLLDPSVEPLDRYAIGIDPLLNPSVENLPVLVNAGPESLNEVDLQIMLRPLLMAAFMVLEELTESQFWHCQQIIVSCASSKTAMGLSYFLQEYFHTATALERPAIIGLTSESKQEFVRTHGHYDRVESYENFRQLDQADTVLMDFSGNFKMQRMLMYYLKERLIHAYALGACHWGEQDAGEVITSCEYFSALDFYYQRQAGSSDLNTRFQQSWPGASAAFTEWLKPLAVNGPEGVRWVYEQILAGTSQPDVAYLCKL